MVYRGSNGGIWAGFTSIHRVCPGPSSGLPTDGYEIYLGVGWNFWIVFCCFLIGLGLLIPSDRIWNGRYHTSCSSVMISKKVMYDWNVAGRDWQVDPWISSGLVGKIKNIRLNYVLCIKKKVYIYYGLPDIAIPRDNCHRQEGKYKIVIVRTSRSKTRRFDGSRKNKTLCTTPPVITVTGFRRWQRTAGQPAGPG